MLTVALEDGKIIGDETKALAKVAGGGGIGAEQVRGLEAAACTVATGPGGEDGGGTATAALGVAV